jgi:hypothetical protein
MLRRLACAIFGHRWFHLGVGPVVGFEWVVCQRCGDSFTNPLRNPTEVAS